jgi:hypothetical protein
VQRREEDSDDYRLGRGIKGGWRMGIKIGGMGTK